MTDTTIENGEVTRYLAAIRTALEDLPAEDRDELLEDLEAHLHEVLAEGEGGLAVILGSPAEYAAELRASAGLAPAPVGDLPLLRRMEQTVSRSPLWHLAGAVSEQPWVRSVAVFLPTLRPAWWVVRAWLSVFAVVVWLHNSVIAPYRDAIVVPTYHDNWVIGLVVTLVAVVGSVWLGLRTADLPAMARHLIVAGNILVVFAFLVRFGDIQNISQGYSGGFDPVPAISATPAAYPGITIDGRHPLNIYPYDAQGHLLAHVRLYDDRGRPLQGLGKSNAPGQDLVRVLPSDAAGAIVANEYPQTVGGISGQQLGVDVNGNAKVVPTAGPSAVAAYAMATPMPTPTIFVPPMAGAAPSPSPTPSLARVVTPTSTGDAAHRSPKRAAKPRPVRSR